MATRKPAEYETIAPSKVPIIHGQFRFARTYGEGSELYQAHLKLFEQSFRGFLDGLLYDFKGRTPYVPNKIMVFKVIYLLTNKKIKKPLQAAVDAIVYNLTVKNPLILNCCKYQNGSGDCYVLFLAGKSLHGTDRYPNYHVGLYYRDVAPGEYISDSLFPVERIKMISMPSFKRFRLTDDFRAKARARAERKKAEAKGLSQTLSQTVYKSSSGIAPNDLDLKELERYIEMRKIKEQKL